MALKGDRNEEAQRISWFMNEVGERGGVVVRSTAGSGAALDQGAALATYNVAGAGSGAMYPLGILLNDMVNLDQTRQHINFHKNEVQKGGKVTLARRGEWVTNMTSGTMTGCGGKSAYLGNYGRFTVSSYDSTLGPLVKVGQFTSNPDEDGYVKVDLNIVG